MHKVEMPEYSDDEEATPEVKVEPKFDQSIFKLPKE